MVSLDRRFTQVTRCTHAESCENRVIALRMILKYKLLDVSQHPIGEQNLKDIKHFNCVVSNHLSYLSADWDAERPHYVLKDVNENRFSNINDLSRACINPLSYAPLRVDCSKKHVTKVFASIKYMANG